MRGILCRSSREKTTQERYRQIGTVSSLALTAHLFLAVKYEREVKLSFQARSTKKIFVVINLRFKKQTRRLRNRTAAFHTGIDVTLYVSHVIGSQFIAELVR